MTFLKSLQNNKCLIASIVGISLILIFGQWFKNEIVFDRDAINLGQWWKIISGNFTHSNIPHLLLNLAGIWILGLLFIDKLRSRTFIFSILFLSIVVGLGLYFFNHELNQYYGFSGVLYGLYFVAAVGAILQDDKFTGFSVALLIAAKVIWDFFTGGNQSSAELIGIPVANDAHLYGFMGAIVIAVFLLIDNKKRHPPTF